ncbi:hypothetical protein MKW98_000026 [Papaver atlanticum]|uniref:Uncharacterized protein n=1 Tax=Papaver atlanticum TaxID=357466 RepID=A0AAD4XAQ1_9MAGN|nr:hypothetical protein MKW98_000026 [Papaver atlanticum]
MVGQIIGGIKANSLAIQTDVLHLLSDIVSYAISLFSLWVSSLKATPQYTYGFYRMEILGALASVLLTWIVTGSEVQGWIMVLISSLDFLLNLILVFLLGHGANFNIQAAYVHAFGDSILSIGVLVGGIIIWVKPKLKIVDLICTLVFSVFVLRTTLPLIREIYRVLMQAAPDGVDASVLAHDLCEMEEVLSVHEVHIWCITAGKVLVSCHVTVKEDANSYTVKDKVIQHIKQEYKIDTKDITVQTELSKDATVHD